MPASATSAVVLRSRVGRNLIIHTQGIDNRDAVNSVSEAVKVLQYASANADPGDIAATVQGLPLACGSICIYHDRWRVLYRVIGHTVMFFIVPSFVNTLHALDFLERAVRVVTLDFRSIETTPEKLWRRYPEIYLSLGILFQSYGCFTARRSLVEANMALESMAPSKKAKEEKEGEMDKAALEKRAAAERKAADKKAAAEMKAEKKAAKKAAGNKRLPTTPENAPGGIQGQGPENLPPRRPKKRTIAEVGSSSLPGVQQPIETQDPLRNLTALPGFEVGPIQRGGPGFHAQMAALELEAKKQAGSLGDMLDEMFGGGPAGKGQKARDDKKKKGEDPFGFVNEELAPIPPPPPPPPPVPAAPLLRLHETWRAKVEGSVVTHVGMSGAVNWAIELMNLQPQVPVVGFGLHLPPTDEQQRVLDEHHAQAQARRTELAKEKMKGMQELQAATTALEQELAQQLQQSMPPDDVKREMVKHALKALWMHPGAVKQGWPPSVHISDTGFTADTTHGRMLLWPPLLKYAIPAVRAPVPQPLQVAVGGALEPVEEEHQTGALVGLSLQLAKELTGDLQPAEVEIKLSYPPLYELPARVTPHGAILDGSKHQLCWKVDANTEQGQQMLGRLTEEPIAFSAVFLVPAGLAASQGALRQVLAEVVVHGRKGTTLTGTTLLQHGFYGKREGESACSWTATASGRPRIPTMQSMR